MLSKRSNLTKCNFSIPQSMLIELAHIQFKLRDLIEDRSGVYWLHSQLVCQSDDGKGTEDRDGAFMSYQCICCSHTQACTLSSRQYYYATVASFFLLLLLCHRCRAPHSRPDRSLMSRKPPLKWQQFFRREAISVNCAISKLFHKLFLLRGC